MLEQGDSLPYSTTGREWCSIVRYCARTRFFEGDFVVVQLAIMKWDEIRFAMNNLKTEIKGNNRDNYSGDHDCDVLE